MTARTRFAGALGLAAILWLCAAASPPPAAAPAPLRIAGQLLAFEKGYVFLTSGEAFKTVANPSLVDERGTPLKIEPSLGAFVRLSFDGDGAVTRVEASLVPFGAADPPAAAERYSVVTPLVRATGATLTQLRNERVTVAFTVQVPTTTLPGDGVYMETSETSWNPLAIRLDRIDYQRFRVVLSVPVGSRFRYLFTRGNSQSIERGANGLQRPARALLVRDLEDRAVFDKVVHWGDEAGLGTLAGPQASPTPFNPAPYPNLPPVKINPAPPK